MRLLLASVLCLGACRAPEPSTSSLRADPAPPRPAPPLAPPEPARAAGGDQRAGQAPAQVPETDSTAPVALGSVAGSPITAEELLVEWHGISGQELFLVLEKIVTSRLAVAEAQRLGLRLEPERVDLRLAEEKKRLRDEVVASGTTMSLEEHVRTRLGVKPEVFFARMRLAILRQMVAERAVRRWTLENEWARVRMIAVATEEEMQAVEEALAAGADFAELARERSFDDTAPVGGLVPFLVRQEASPLCASVFAAEPGGLAGPLRISGKEVLLLVEELHDERPGDWTVVKAEVESSLEAHPVTDSEFLTWKLTMEERYPIDVRPLMELLGIDG